MKKVYQTNRGVGGNCFAACIASILEYNLEDIDVELSNCNTTAADLFNKIRNEKELIKDYDLFLLPYWMIKGIQKYNHACALPIDIHCIILFNDGGVDYRGKKFGHACVGYMDNQNDITLQHDPESESLTLSRYKNSDITENLIIGFLIKG
jgi:hypothetical protein